MLISTPSKISHTLNQSFYDVAMSYFVRGHELFEKSINEVKILHSNLSFYFIEKLTQKEKKKKIFLQKPSPQILQD